MQQIGSKWWKFDFHTHTPASFDYGRGDKNLKDLMTPHEWLMKFVEKGVECVAITDHNSGGWIDKLKEEAAALRAQNYSIYVFPGIEVTSNGNVHILGIFDPTESSNKISELIGSINYKGTQGDSDAVTGDSPESVIKKIIEKGGVAIPAHIDKKAGLCSVHSSGYTLEQVLDECSAVEIITRNDEYEAVESTANPLRGYISLNKGLAEVIGSDSHIPADVGRAFTWVKMGAPSINGLKLALYEADESIKRSDIHPGDPNLYAENRLLEVKISNTKYCGRVKEFNINFHPWLNCIIGGRGSGKSSLVEFIRLGLAREKELNSLTKNGELYENFKKFAKVSSRGDDDGVLLSNSDIKILYEKSGEKYLLHWSNETSNTKIFRVDGDGYIEEDGDVESRFPIHIYSQKQIYEISRSPDFLLKIIDGSTQVNYFTWKLSWDDCIRRYIRNQSDIRELEQNIKIKSTLIGQLSDVKRKIESIANSGHAKIFSEYQIAMIERTNITNYVSNNKEAIQALYASLESTSLKHLDSAEFSNQQGMYSEFADKLSGTNSSISDVKKNVKGWLDYGVNQLNDFYSWYASSSLKSHHDMQESEYLKLVQNLKDSGVNNPNEYHDLIISEKDLNEKLHKISLDEESVRLKNNNSILIYSELVALRTDLTRRRERFLNDLGLDDTYIKVDVIPFGNLGSIDESFRNLIAKNDGTFASDLIDNGEGILATLINKVTKETSDEKMIGIIDDFKTPFVTRNSDEVLGVKLSKRFNDLKNSLSTDVIDRLKCWFPDDEIKIKFKDGNKFRDISQGSAGQKAATVLAFLLSYSNDPLILDQPEDDLDNRLIYNLIVKRLKETKKSRQVMVITHNANIVVNGDAEYVVALSQNSGSTFAVSNGGLQDDEVRTAICDIMEGGKVAFEQRYKRIINL